MLDGWHETHAYTDRLHVALTGRPVNGDIVSWRAAGQCLAATAPHQSHDRAAHVSGTLHDTTGGCEQGVALSDREPKMVIEGRCPISGGPGRIFLLVAGVACETPQGRQRMLGCAGQ
jgi:hypothetical protein